MKNLGMRFLSLFGVALLAVATLFSFASCGQEPDPGNGGKPPEIPAELQNTEWTNDSGDKISFDRNSATVTPFEGTAQKFSLKDSSSIDQSGIKQTILFFKDGKSPDDSVTFRNGSVTMVNFSIIPAIGRANGWVEGGGSNGVNISDFEFKNDYSHIYDGDWGKTISGYVGNGGNVILPSAYLIYVVSSIEERTFYNKNISSVTIPDSIVTIGKEAFASNGVLVSITIGNNVVSWHYINSG